MLGELSLLRGLDPILAAPIPRLLLLDCSPLSVFLPPETPQKNPKILKLSSFSWVPPPFQALHIAHPPSLTRPLESHALLFGSKSRFYLLSNRTRAEERLHLSSPKDPCTQIPFHLPPKPSALTCSSVALGRHCSVVGILEPAVGAAGKVVKVTVDAPPPPHPQHTHTPETANTSSKSLSVATMKSKGPVSASGPDPELGLDPGTCPWPQVLTRSQALGALTQPQALIWD